MLVLVQRLGRFPTSSVLQRAREPAGSAERIAQWEYRALSAYERIALALAGWA